MHNANLLKPSTQAKETRFILCTWNSNIRQAMIVITSSDPSSFQGFGQQKIQKRIESKEDENADLISGEID